MRVVLCTTPPDRAEEIAESVVGARLAACASVVPGVRSVYRWQGAIHRDEEALLVIKTTEERLAALVEHIRGVHPYDVPEIIALPIDGGLPEYLRWIREETTDPGGSP